MNLNELKQITEEERTRKVEFVFRDQPTGLILELVHESSERYQKAERAYRNKLSDAAMKRKSGQRDRVNNDWIDFGSLIAKVVGWEWKQGTNPDEGRPAFSAKELRETLQSGIGYHLRNFILEETERLDDFFGESETISAPS